MAYDRELHLRVRTECCSHGVSVLAMTGYWNFAQQVDKGRRKLHGEELRLYVAALIERYVKLGLERKVLEDIRFNVFTISSPAAETQTPNPKSQSPRMAREAASTKSQITNKHQSPRGRKSQIPNTKSQA